MIKIHVYFVMCNTLHKGRKCNDKMEQSVLVSCCREMTGASCHKDILNQNQNDNNKTNAFYFISFHSITLLFIFYFLIICFTKNPSPDHYCTHLYLA